MVLRELAIDAHVNWDSLSQRFMQHAMVKDVPVGPRLDDLRNRGQCLIMLDGIDEIGSIAVRNALRETVFEGIRRYPACRWVLTSRIVGYDQVPFDHIETWTKLPWMKWDVMRPTMWRRHDFFGDPDLDSYKPVTLKRTALGYVSPFNDEQIARFAQQWFAQRDPVAERAAAGAQSLIRAIHADPSTLRLARIPNLLTMMALIYRVRARLPHGRAVLYNEITQAYLQSIDEYRGLKEGTDYPLAQKKRWLARVAFEMQLRRSQQAQATGTKGDKPQDSEARDILVSAEEAEGWIATAMAESGYPPERGAAPEFVDYIKRRSGLLLPRGAGPQGVDLFAFMHLSFQEYFAACFLEEQITSPPWLTTGQAAAGAEKEALRLYGRQPVWRETLIFLFELLADRTGWPKVLAHTLFGEGFTAIEPADAASEPAAVLLASLAADPHSGLPAPLRGQAIDACCRWEIHRQAKSEVLSLDYLMYEPSVARALLAGDSPDWASFWSSFVGALKETGRGPINLRNTPVFDLGPLAQLKDVQALILDGTQVAQLRPLEGLPNLTSLHLSFTPVSDLSALASLSSLKLLVLNNTPVSDLAPLRGLTTLESLCVGGTRVSELAPIAGLTELYVLDLSDTLVSDISPLRRLKKLAVLDLHGTAVSDVRPLLRLAGLRRLLIDRSRISDGVLESLNDARKRNGLPEIEVGEKAARVD